MALTHKQLIDIKIRSFDELMDEISSFAKDQYFPDVEYYEALCNEAKEKYNRIISKNAQ